MKVIDLRRIMILFQRQTGSEQEMLYHQQYMVCLNERKKAAGQFLLHVQVEAGLYSYSILNLNFILIKKSVCQARIMKEIYFVV